MNDSKFFLSVLISCFFFSCQSKEEKLKEHVLGTWFFKNGSHSYSNERIKGNPAIGAYSLSFTKDSLFIEFSNFISTSSNNSYTLEKDILSFNDMTFYFPHQPIGEHQIDCKYTVVFQSDNKLEYSYQACYEKLAVRYKISNDSIIYEIDNKTYSGKATMISNDTLRLQWHDNSVNNVTDYYRMPVGTRIETGVLFDRKKLKLKNPGTCTICFEENKWKKITSYTGEVSYTETYTPISYPDEIDLTNDSFSWYNFVLTYNNYFLEVYDYTGSELHLIPVLSARVGDQKDFVYYTDQVIVYERVYE